MVIDSSEDLVTRRLVLPLIEPRLAVMVVFPVFCPVALPPNMVATLASDEVQLAAFVMF